MRTLLVTSNIGSIFEEGDCLGGLCTNWIRETSALIKEHSPAFIGFHFQEVGGKTAAICQDRVEQFFQRLFDLPVLAECSSAYGYVDQECENKERYTAMGAAYFIHKSISSTTEHWNFATEQFEPISNEHRTFVPFYSDGCADMNYVFKMKYPMSCYSKKQVTPSRKGFIWKRWKFSGHATDTINIHLAHDNDNVIATLTSPSRYTKYRSRCLSLAMDTVRDEKATQFLFGDFNVRPDTKEMIEYLMKNTVREELRQDGAKWPHTLTYKSSEDSEHVLLEVKPRYFHFSCYKPFDRENVPELISLFDRELDWIKKDWFHEFPITFQPTYSHTEDSESGTSTFEPRRCPSWCDRILLSQSLHSELQKKSVANGTIYNSFATETIVGDHKPVFLAFDMLTD